MEEWFLSPIICSAETEAAVALDRSDVRPEWVDFNELLA
jgi:hypothetical protein